MSSSNIHQSLHLTRVANGTPAACTVPGIKLGQATNLLLGFKPGWVATNSSTAPFFPPDTAPLPTSDATVSPEISARWGFPRITLHKDTNSLLSAVYPYNVRPLIGDDSTFSVPSGPLLVADLDGAEMLRQLSSDLGVDLTAGYSYMLVELVRCVGTASRTYVAGAGGNAADHLTPDALAAINTLPGVAADPAPSDQLTAPNADSFLKNFQALGTHYVSQVTAGDRILQVFAYKETAFQELTRAFTRSAEGKNYVDGLNAIAFQYYTTPLSSETGVELGYVSERGAVRIVSNDPAFATSVQAGSWNDPAHANGNSIFAVYPQPSKLDLSGFQAVVPIAFELTPLGNLIPVDKCPAGRQSWGRLLKGALLQKYGQHVSVTFPAARSAQWQTVLPNAGAWLSTIATPTVNVYNEHLGLDEIQLTNRAAVKSFSSWSVVLNAGTGTVKIPGDNVSVSSYLIDTSGSEAPPTIELASQTAYQNVSLACGRMDGACIIGYTGGAERTTVMDGILLQTRSTATAPGRHGVEVKGDLFGAQEVARLEAQESNLNFSIVTCQTLLYSRGDTAAAAQDLARGCLLWLTDIIPDTEATPQALAALRLRAAYLGHVARRLDEEGVTVPYLTYSNYSDYIQAMSTAANTLTTTVYRYQNQIDIQKNAELTAKTAAEINANVKTSGKLLKDYIDAVATNQGDIATNYQKIITTKQREIEGALKNYTDLAQAVSDQKDVVELAKLDFESAMRTYEITEIIKAVINISIAVVTVGLEIASPSTVISAFKGLADLEEVAQKIQKMIKVLNAIMALEKTLEGTVRSLVGVTQTLDALRRTKLEMPTSREWSEMSLNFEACLASAPPEVAGPKAHFVAAFKILVLRAQEMLTTQAKIVQLQADIALNQAQQTINEHHQKRLNALTQALHLGDTSTAPNLSEVDLLSLTGYVQSQLNQVLASLAQALILQDSAIQFELLSTPTPIRKFDLSSLQIVMARQQANIIAAKEAFNPPPFKVHDPIQVTIQGVPIAQFTGGNTYEFQIQPGISEFQPYNMVRVQQVVVDIPAIQGSRNGKYRIDLAFAGHPFEDRSPSGAPLMFNTVTRYFGPFEYKVQDHTPVFGDQTGAIGSAITRVTPFSTWHVSMPKMEVNEELDFGSDLAVDIVLSFRIEALANSAVQRFCHERGTLPATLPHRQLMAAMQPGPLRALGSPALDDTSSIDYTLHQMYQSQGVLKGWDCVLNMLEEPVNQFLAAQYQAKYPGAQPMTVAVGFCQAIASGNATILAYTRFSVKLGPPLLAFQTNNHDYVAVTQAIQSGFLQTGSTTVQDKNARCPDQPNFDDPAIQWGDKTPIDVSTKPTVTGSVPLGIVQGLVEPTKPDGSKGNTADAHSVILDFAKGSFNAKNLNINTNAAELNLQLSNWFVTNPIQYLINTVVFNDVTTLKALQPTKFKLNVLTTNSKKNVLQVFITTTGQQQNNLTINVNEPIPDGYHNSLMINTKIMFADIFVQSFNKGSTNLQVAGVKPENDITPWKAQVSSGTVSGQVTFQNTGTNETRISASGNTITWPLKGLVFAPTENLDVSLNYTSKQTVNFETRQWVPPTFGGSPSAQVSPGYWPDKWDGHSVDVDVTLTGNYPITVNNSSGRPEIQIASAPPNVTVTPPVLQPSGPTPCDDNNLKIMVENVLKQEVPKKLQESMAGITFAHVSVFALYNLLFPTGDFIEMKRAGVPGDLVVFGTFNKFVSHS